MNKYFNLTTLIPRAVSGPRIFNYRIRINSFSNFQGLVLNSYYLLDFLENVQRLGVPALPF